jgi:hypothetical protein
MGNLRERLLLASSSKLQASDDSPEQSGILAIEVRGKSGPGLSRSS